MPLKCASVMFVSPNDILLLIASNRIPFIHVFHEGKELQTGVESGIYPQI